MSDQSNVDLIESVYEAFRRGDMASILERLDPRAELEFEGPSIIPWAGNRHGRDGWAKFFQAIGENIEVSTLTMRPFAAQGDHVVAVGRYQALVKRTGKRIDSPLVHLWTIGNGRIVRCQELTNTAAEAAACTPDGTTR
jgi:ketosteroid isomerase-like protein